LKKLIFVLVLCLENMVDFAALTYRFTYKCRKCILITWLIVVCVFFHLGSDFVNAVKLGVKNTPDDTLSMDAENILAAHFDDLNRGTLIAYLLAQDDCPDIILEECGWESFVKDYAYNITHSSETDPSVELEVSDYWSLPLNSSNFTDIVAGKEFLSETNPKAMIISMTYSTVASSEDKVNMLEYAQKFCGEGKCWGLGTMSDGRFFGMTGILAMGNDALAEVKKDLVRIDIVTIPMAFMLMAYMLRSCRVLIITIINIILTLFISYGTMYIIACKIIKYDNINSVVTNFMEVLCLALSIDYSLFFLTRFKGEIKKGSSKVDAVKTSIHRAGHVILMSGSTLLLVFVGFTMVSNECIEQIGIGCGVTIFFAISVSLTFTPAMVNQFPNFFGNFEDCVPWMKDFQWCCMRLYSRDKNLLDPEHDVLLISNNSLQAEGISKADDLEFNNSNQVRQSVQKSHLDIEVSYAEKERIRMKTNYWYKLGSRLTKRPCSWITIVALYLVALPLAYFCTQLKYNISFKTVIPANTESAETLDDLSEAYNPGIIEPFTLVLTCNSGKPCLSDEVNGTNFFNMAGEVCDQLMSTGDVQYFLGPAYIPINETVTLPVNNKRVAIGPYVPWNFANFVINRPSKNETVAGCVAACEEIPHCKESGFQLYCSEFYDLLTSNCSDLPEDVKNLDLEVSCPDIQDFVSYYRYIYGEDVSKDNSTMRMTLSLAFDPTDLKVEDWIVDTRNTIDKVLSMEQYKHRYTVLLYSTTVSDYDMMMKVFDEFPVLIGVTVTIVFVLMAFFLKSAFTPIRLATTLIIPIAAVFGIAILVYQYGALDWLGWDSVKSQGSLYWFVPIITIIVTLGLALDYDCFIISRIVEHRTGGYSLEASIGKAMHETGGVITCAGVIMALAFGGQLLAENPSINQIGWVLSTSVIIDTFVMRTMLVPSIMSFTDKVAWWPRVVPRDELLDEFDNKLGAIPAHD
jgi:uncharacterized membrane protein YdfJ with MMPL/SSD domain